MTGPRGDGSYYFGIYGAGDRRKGAWALLWPSHSHLSHPLPAAIRPIDDAFRFTLAERLTLSTQRARNRRRMRRRSRQ